MRTIPHVNNPPFRPGMATVGFLKICRSLEKIYMNPTLKIPNKISATHTPWPCTQRPIQDKYVLRALVACHVAKKCSHTKDVLARASWNSLPASLRCISSSTLFSQQLRLLLDLSGFLCEIVCICRLYSLLLSRLLCLLMFHRLCSSVTCSHMLINLLHCRRATLHCMHACASICYMH